MSFLSRSLGLRRPLVTFGLGSDARTPATPVACFDIAVLCMVAQVTVASGPSFVCAISSPGVQATTMDQVSLSAGVRSASLDLEVALAEGDGAVTRAELTCAVNPLVRVGAEVFSPSISLVVQSATLAAVVAQPVQIATEVAPAINFGAPLDC